MGVYSRLAKTLIYQEVMTETMVKDLIRPQRADGGVGGALGAGCALRGNDGDASVVVDVFAGDDKVGESDGVVCLTAGTDRTEHSTFICHLRPSNCYRTQCIYPVGGKSHSCGLCKRYRDDVGLLDGVGLVHIVIFVCS